MATNEKLIESLKEMIDYAEHHKGLSYYDLKAYAYNNDKLDWIAVLNNKHYRQDIALWLKSKRKRDKVPYTNSFCDSVMSSLEAEIAFDDRHSKNIGEFE